MDEREGLADRFDEHRPRLWAIAYRMLGFPGDADDGGSGRNDLSQRGTRRSSRTPAATAEVAAASATSVQTTGSIAAARSGLVLGLSQTSGEPCELLPKAIEQGGGVLQLEGHKIAATGGHSAGGAADRRAERRCEASCHLIQSKPRHARW